MAAIISEPPVGDRALPPRRRSRTVVGAVIAAVVLLLGGAITAVAVSVHYAQAPALECVCFVGWAPGEHSHPVNGLLEDGSAVDNSPTGRHTYYVAIANRASVTQTILGSESFLNEKVTVGSAGLGMHVPDRMHFTALPVSLAPGEDRYFRIELQTCLPRGATAAWDYIPLRVRVGAFTRTENVALRFALGIVGKHVHCG